MFEAEEHQANDTYCQFHECEHKASGVCEECELLRPDLSNEFNESFNEIFNVI